MHYDVPALLGAASSAIPTLLLALVLQRPLLLGLIRAAGAYRAGVQAFEANPVGRFLLAFAPGPYTTIAKNIDYCIIAAGVLGMITSVALQAVPDSLWTARTQWHDLAGLIVWAHVVVVALLALTVGAGLLVIDKGARADPDASA